MRLIVFSVLSLLITAGLSARAEESNWLAVTVDNDRFFGYDNGYTNGVYLSWFELSDRSSPGWLLFPLAWSIDTEKADKRLSVYTLGQIMVTPEDITIENPPLNDVPYSGSLVLNHTFVSVHEAYADAISAVVGIVGPSSGGEATQKWFHDVIGADDPKGWDTQLHDEVIFQFSRGRLWRLKVAENDRVDLLATLEGGVGTLSSLAAAGTVLRFGKNLTTAFSTPLLSGSRSANPAAIDGGWYVYAGLRFEYVFNQIFTDGNTYRDSRSIDFDRSQIGITAGWAYSWRALSITFALNDFNVTENATREFTRFGTLTLGWKY